MVLIPNRMLRFKIFTTSRCNHSFFWLASLVCLLVLPALAQDDSTSTGADSGAGKTLAPRFPPNAPVDHETVEPRSSKSPWLAVGLSAVGPGLGQIYNEDYWKVPVIWGLSAYWISEWISLHNQYNDFRDQYAASVLEFPPNGDDRYLRLRDSYRDERDKFAWFLGGLYFLNLVDAYVGANLYDFDVSSDLGADGSLGRRVTASIRLRF